MWSTLTASKYQVWNQKANLHWTKPIDYFSTVFPYSQNSRQLCAYKKYMCMQCYFHSDSWMGETGQRLIHSIWPHRFLDSPTHNIPGKVKGRQEMDSLNFCRWCALDVSCKSASYTCRPRLQPFCLKDKDFSFSLSREHEIHMDGTDMLTSTE